jgi:hypothetical protein
VSMASTLAHVHIQINGLGWPSASVLIACLALAFTIASFWWINARQGQLKSFEPHTFAAVFRQHDLVTLLRFPLVLHNTGAKPIVVQDMRLSFPKESRSDLPLPWRATRSQIKPGGKDDSHEFPAVFSIPGRTALQMFIEFGGPFPGVIPMARDYQALIEVKLGHRKKWKRLLLFTIRAAHITGIEKYITYSNAPHDLTPEVIAEAQASLESLRKDIEGRSAL